MTKYVYSALVTEQRTYPVHVVLDVPDGRSPWGPDARKAAREAALKAAAVAEYTGEQPQLSSTVRLTTAREED